MGINWSLECCNDKQLLSIFLIVCYAVVIFKLYVLIRLVAVAFFLVRSIDSLSHVLYPCLYAVVRLQMARVYPPPVQDPVGPILTYETLACWVESSLVGCRASANPRVCCFLLFVLWMTMHRTVFLHELGHATAAWLTCGSVRSGTCACTSRSISSVRHMSCFDCS